MMVISPCTIPRSLMTTLIPMQQDAFKHFMDTAIIGYAEDNVSSGRWPADGAVERSRADYEESLPQGLSTPDNYLFEIRDDQKNIAVGFIWFGLVENNGIKSAFVYDVEVIPEYRRQGYARSAFQALESVVRNLGVKSISLHVFGHNTQAQALYSSLGFQITGINMQKTFE